MNTIGIKKLCFLMWYAVVNITRIGPGMVSYFFSHFNLRKWPPFDLGFVFRKNELYVFIILNIPPLWLKKIIYFLHISYHFAQNKFFFLIITLKFLSFLWKNDVLSVGVWTTTARHSVSDHMQTQAKFFYNEDSPEILK